MADVEKLNINSTDYDIADAKALRTKDTLGANCFVDRNAGNASYPTESTNLSNSLFIGYTARYVGTPVSVSGITAIGYSAQVFNTNSTAVGANARALALQATALGAYSYAPSNYSLAVGYNANASGQYATSVGMGCATTQNYTVTVGASASTNGQYSIAIGYNARVDNGASYGIALGRGAIVSASASYACQIGQGTNSTNNTLQFRNWRIIENNGKLAEDRLPDGVRTATPRFPNLYDIDEEKISEQAILYTGTTNDMYKNSQFYCGRVRYGYPHFACGWVDSEWLDSQNDVMIDQQKLFTKLAEITKQRIDDDNTENGLIGGDNSEMSIYLKYDADNDYYFLGFDSDSFEKAFNGTPDDITGLSFDDFADYGIYFRNFHKPSDLEGEYEICDIYYYAPVYIDSYDWNNSPSYVDYFKFLSALYDSDWGIGYVIPDMDEWTFVVDGTTYNCPIIPKTYEYDGSEYDYVELRWEWDDDVEKWIQYINGEDISRSWTTAEMYTKFGIKIEPGEEENIEYIDFYVRGGDQRYWGQFDPVDASHFASKTEFNNLQSRVNVIDNYKCFQRIQTSTDLNTLTNYGAYKIEHTYTNGPDIATPTSPNTVSYVFVTATPGTIRQVLIPGVIITNDGYRRYYPPLFYRCYVNGVWSSWYEMLSTTGENITGYDSNATQYLTHGPAGTMKWGTGGGSSYTAGDGIDITSDVISVDDLDCGTM